MNGTTKHLAYLAAAVVRQFNETAPIRATYNTRSGYELALAREPALRELRAIERAFKVATHYRYGWR